ncbi:NHLP leader peptide domain-containing protein [Paenibacillus sp. UNC496MF]|uniref:NHLP leader peptide family RiPP precursor n=1 Tax=Paenibacillus sp. UNC496MF TaxID=1502753 RepID=UPI0008E0AB21|nr:NHLP leader peptide family RiPP precursor [Paenibacillus sp. UNC496MF]SFI48786.1 NHLP leader peptide domain-containing protein [Paenibacillus sp. UNC496MF]
MTEQQLQQQIIEKAWSDPAFKAKLLANPKEALQEAFGLSLPDDVELVVVEETPTKFALVLPQNPADAGKTDESLDTW